MNKIEILQSPNLKEENKISKGDGIGIIDEPVAEPNSIEVWIVFKAFQNLCLYQQKGNGMQDFYNDLNHCMPLMLKGLESNLVL